MNSESNHRISGSIPSPVPAGVIDDPSFFSADKLAFSTHNPVATTYVNVLM